MTLEQLKAFAAVVKHGSVRAASSEIYKSAPSISSAIKALESHLAMELFSREGYRLILTDDGQNFYAKVRQILRSLTELDGLSKDKWKKKNQIINIAVDACFDQQNIVQMIATVSQSFPEMQLNIATEYHGGAFDKLYSGAVDLAVTPMWGAIEDDVDIKYIDSVPIIPVARADSSIARRTRPINPVDILDETQVIIGNLKGKDAGVRCTKITGAKSFSVTDMQTKRSLILSGLGWGELPVHMINKQLDEGTLVALEIEDYQQLRCDHYLVRRSDTQHSSVSQKIWESFNTQVSTEKRSERHYQVDLA